jgi:hypothetical protein
VCNSAISAWKKWTKPIAIHAANSRILDAFVAASDAVGD